MHAKRAGQAIRTLCPAALIAVSLFFLDATAGLKVLVFTKSLGYNHPTMDAMAGAIKKMEPEQGWSVTLTKTSSEFTDAGLAKYDVVVFNNNCMSQAPGTPAELVAFEKFIKNGGGYVGIHGATYVNFQPQWTFYIDLAGAIEKSPGKNIPLTLKPVNAQEPTTAMFPAGYSLADEYVELNRDLKTIKYANPADSIEILLKGTSTSESSLDYKTGHPISWRHTFQGGRSFYMGFGHNDGSVNDKYVLQHLAKGIQWAGTKTTAVVPPYRVAVGRDEVADQYRGPLAAFNVSGRRLWVEHAFRIRVLPGMPRHTGPARPVRGHD